jgi:hypothetical protein
MASVSVSLFRQASVSVLLCRLGPASASVSLFHQVLAWALAFRSCPFQESDWLPLSLRYHPGRRHEREASRYR